MTPKCQMNFLDKSCKKRSKTKKVNTIESYILETVHQILHIGINLGSKFQLQQTISVFWNKFQNKTILPFENRKTDYHHWLQHIPISWRTKFQLKLTILILFWSSLPEKFFRSHAKNKKENHHWILHIQIRICTEFQLKLFKLTILIFWKEFNQEKYLWYKTDKMNIDFCIFELV